MAVLISNILRYNYPLPGTWYLIPNTSFYYFCPMPNRYSHLIIFYSLIFCNHASNAQYSFQRLIGGVSQERGQALFQTSDGGYLYDGATLSYGAGSADCFFVKTDSLGNLVWSAVYGTSSYDNAEYAIQAYDNSILGVGRTFFPGNTTSDALLFKTDSVGHLLWGKTYGSGNNEGIPFMIETRDHGYALIGATQSIGAGSEDILFIRTDENGDTLFTRAYGSAESEVGLSIVEDAQGGFVICGKQTLIIGGLPYADGFILKTDASGDLVWSNLYGDSLWEELQSIQIASSGDIVTCGSITSFGAGKYDILAMRTDSLGAVRWGKTYGGAEIDASYGIIQNADSTYTLSGYTNSLGYGHENRGDDSTNIFLMKISSLGDTIWTRTYGDGLQDEAYRNNPTADGGYLVSGFTTNYAFQDSAQMILIKTDSLGFTGCHEFTSHPILGDAPLQSRPVSFVQSSGISPGNINLIQLFVNTDNEDACLYTSNQQLRTSSRSFLFPNPSEERVSIQFPAQERVKNCEISDLQGREIQVLGVDENADSGSATFSVASLVSGVYLIRIDFENGATEVLKMIKR